MSGEAVKSDLLWHSVRGSAEEVLFQVSPQGCVLVILSVNMSLLLKTKTD